MSFRIGDRNRNRNLIFAQTQSRVLWCLARRSIFLILLAASALFGLTGASAAQAADPLAWSPATLVDTGPHPINAILDVSCPSTSLCVATDEDGNVLTSTNPTGGEEEDWAAPVNIDPGHPLEKISCPTTTLCVAVDGYGDAFTSTEPTGGTSKWHETKIDPTLSGEDSYSFATFVSCPTTKFCAVVTGSRELITSTEPLGGASKWTISTNENMGAGYFSSLSCQSETLCVTDYSVAEDSSFIYSSTDPAGGWTHWSHTGSVSWLGGLVGPSCPTSSLCIGGSGSNVVTSTSPATGPWIESGPVENSWFNDISCASASLCVGVENGQGHLSVSTEPTGGATNWHVIGVGGYLDSLSSVSCVPNTTTCVAADYEGNIISSTSPTTSWDSIHVDNSAVTKPDSVESVSCASASLCVAGDAYGRVLYSTDPKAGASSWSIPVTASDASIEALDCIPGLCVGAGEHGYYDQIVASTNPTGGEEDWDVVSDAFDEWTSISCASAKLCVAVANGGEIASSATPTVFGSWSVSSVVPAGDFTGVSCPSESLCVAVNGRSVYTNTTPTNAGAWTPTTLVPENGAWFSGVSCPTTTRCFASEEDGNTWTSTDPTGGVGAWTKIKVNEGGLWGVSCPTTSFCAGMEQDGTVYVSKEPTVEGSWYETKLTEGSFKNQTLQGITCASEELCLATDENGEIATGTQTLAEASKPEEPKGGGGGSGGESSATSGGGSTTPTTTQVVTPAESTPPPILGQRQTASPISGTVTVRVKATTKFVPLSVTTTIPNGSEVEATNGHVLITVATPNGHTQTAEVWGGRFVIDQERTGSGETRFILSLPLTGCPRVSLPRGASAATAAATASTSAAKHNSDNHGSGGSGPKSRHLWVSEGGGSWGTNGRYVSTTVEGTRWLTQDECDRSEVTVAAGKVKVHDLVNDKTKVLTAGKSYTATARRHG